jgi:hypothetical protein
VPKRRLNILRDEEDFTGTEYYQAVGRHLQGSRKLIIICSPNARASSFVNGEIQRFTQVHSAEDLIPVLIAGSPETTSAADDADMAFPAALCERLELPLASDYRGFDPKSSKARSNSAISLAFVGKLPAQSGWEVGKGMCSGQDDP